MLPSRLTLDLSQQVAGLISDASKGCPSLGIGRRKLWYCIGTAVVAVGFFCVFGVNLPILLWDAPSMLIVTVFACISASVFNVGW